MSKMLFDNLLQKKDGLIKGPFGGDIKKSLFVPKTDDAYKVYEQGVVLKNDVQFGDYYISKEHFEKSLRRFEVKSGDILMTGAGTLGKLFFVPEIHPKGVINQALLRIRLNESIITPSFFKYYFKYYIEAIISRLNGDSVIPNLPPLPIIKSTEIDIPVVSTQKSIAKVLSDLDAKIELNNRINRELEAMAKTLYDYWFVQFDFPNEQGKPYKSSGGKMVYNSELKRAIPEGWEVKTLAKVTAVSNESVNPMLTPEQEFKHYSIPTYDSTKTYGIEKGIDIRSNKFVVAESDILVSKLNPWFSRVIYPIKEDDLICSTEFVVWRTSNTNIKNYLFMVAKGEHFISHCSQSATGTSNSHKRVNPTVMMRYKVPFNSELIQKFGSTINSWIKIGINKQIENQQLTELRDWLLPMLMNGQVKVIDKKETELSMAAEPQAEYKKSRT